MAHTERKRMAGSTFSDTMRGSGWLREAPANIFPEEWMKYRGRTALRQCIFLPPPGELPSAPAHRLAPMAVDTLVDPPRHAERVARYAEPVPERERRSPRRPDKLRQVGMWPAVPSAVLRAAQREPEMVVAGVPNADWATRPLGLGLLLVLFPPAGLAAVWSSERYDRDAKLALTFVTALFLSLSAVALLAITLAR